MAIFYLMSMFNNIIEKIWNDHVVKSKRGYPDILAIDLHLIHEVTSPQAFSTLVADGLEVHAPKRCVATVDHNVSTAADRRIATNPVSENQLNTLRKNCRDFGIELLDMDSGRQGIVHVIGPELGLTQPGMTIVCGDSHTSTHGAFGALAFGIGTTEVSHVLATGCMLQEKPKTMRVNFVGKRPKGTTAKDMILKLISEIGVSGGRGYVIEYAGEAIRALGMEERMTICNMTIECGARAGLVAPDDITFDYIKGRKAAPQGKNWDKAIKYWKSLVSSKRAKFDKEVEIDISDLEPMVTWGTNPGQALGISGVIPIEAEDKVLEYVRFGRGDKIEGKKIDYVFIGSCTNARISDLREAAKIFKDKKVYEGVHVFVVPGSEQVKMMAITEGLDKIFVQAGCDFRNPGCSMCLAMNDDKVPAGKRCASTSNRNFVGRQGTGAITHLMSPAMAAAAAIYGRIVDVRKI